MDRSEMERLARIGAKLEAQRLLNWLKSEAALAAIDAVQTASTPVGKRRRAPMTTAQRKAIGRRVKAAWKRRKAEAKGGKG